MTNLRLRLWEPKDGKKRGRLLHEDAVHNRILPAGATWIRDTLMSATGGGLASAQARVWLYAGTGRVGPLTSGMSARDGSRITWEFEFTGINATVDSIRWHINGLDRAIAEFEGVLLTAARTLDVSWDYTCGTGTPGGISSWLSLRESDSIGLARDSTSGTGYELIAAADHASFREYLSAIMVRDNRISRSHLGSGRFKLALY